jgi:hypothetical protein
MELSEATFPIAIIISRKSLLGNHVHMGRSSCKHPDHGSVQICLPLALSRLSISRDNVKVMYRFGTRICEKC